MDLQYTLATDAMFRMPDDGPQSHRIRISEMNQSHYKYYYKLNSTRRNEINIYYTESVCKNQGKI